MDEQIDYNTMLSQETVTYATTGMLHSYDSTSPYVSIMLPPEVAQYYAPMEYEIKIPPAIEWPYMSVGTFAVDVILTLNADTLEVVSLDDVRPNPQLEGGF